MITTIIPIIIIIIIIILYLKWNPCINNVLKLIKIAFANGFVGSEIIFSQILTIQNNNHTQEHKIYVENLFSLKGKTTRETPNNFTIIKSITIILAYVSRLQKKYLLFSLFSHTLIIFIKSNNTLLSHFYFLLHAQLSLDYLLFSKWLTLGCSLFFFLYNFLFLCSCTYSLCVFSKSATLCSLLSLAFLPSKNPFYSLLVSHYIFPLLKGRTLRPKSKTKPKPTPMNSLQHCLFIRLFSYSLLNQEYITSLIRNRLPFYIKEQSFFSHKGIDFSSTSRNSH